MNDEKNTTEERKNAVIVGVLFIIATAFLFIGDAFYGPVLDTPDYLKLAYPNRITAVVGILIEFSCIIAIPLIPVFAFPALRRHSETLALAYLVFRVFEAVLFVLVDITKLSLVKVSELHLATDSAGAETMANIGATIQAWNEWNWFFYVFIFAVGALIFYTVLFQARLLPRWISIWGMIAIIMMASSALLAMFEVELTDAVFGLLVVPIGVQEMVMALWLIIKGFDTRFLTE